MHCFIVINWSRFTVTSYAAPVILGGLYHRAHNFTILNFIKLDSTRYLSANMNSFADLELLQTRQEVAVNQVFHISFSHRESSYAFILNLNPSYMLPLAQSCLIGT